MAPTVKKEKIWCIIYRKNGYLFGMYFSRSKARNTLSFLSDKKKVELKVVRGDVIFKK